MEYLQQALDFFLHLDVHLEAFIRNYGAWTYALLFVIIFAETGLVFAPLLPGDSLLFAAGMLCGVTELNVVYIFVLLTAAAVLGDTVNYWIGKWFGAWILKRGRRFGIRQEYIDKTHAYFEKYGGKTIVIARFVPIVRTFAPFVAGIGTMNYGRFLFYNVFGGVLWVAVCVFAGYFLGKQKFVKDNFELFVLLIILVSILPAVVEVLRSRGRKAQSEISNLKSQISDMKSEA